ncbi:PqqD family protein [Prosthecobacter sp.]|uniref:PqqD family protein n=1 Tax=Prosthecobacter sp. TaxID=1965333 RepID=UPI0024875955|nr:PqqD family protein [Prosthecobacter sp.]MDI1312934.1 PqqD family protein [Prosthecobacter sp.]
MKLASLSTRIHPSGQPHDPALCAGSGSFDFHTVTWQADGFGFDATSGEFFTASPAALIVMQALSEDMARQQILDRLTVRFEVARSTAERDLESFLAELLHIGLTQESI